MKEEKDIVDKYIPKQVDHKMESSVSDPEQGNLNLKNRLLSRDHWLRFLFMVLFFVIALVASYVFTVLVIIQFVFVLIGNRNEEKMQLFGYNLSQYIFQILRFLTYNTEDKPFPFADFSKADRLNDK